MPSWAMTAVPTRVDMSVPFAIAVIHGREGIWGPCGLEVHTHYEVVANILIVLL